MVQENGDRRPGEFLRQCLRLGYCYRIRRNNYGICLIQYSLKKIGHGLEEFFCDGNNSIEKTRQKNIFIKICPRLKYVERLLFEGMGVTNPPNFNF